LTTTSEKARIYLRHNLFHNLLNASQAYRRETPRTGATEIAVILVGIKNDEAKD
jgi:hypothetical protein